ncbi:MAG: GH32 C-terminal domain-containing protein [Verrucomicrobiales bacterium]|nr:GH32 C-terminal domain-containing protein [Verrucomicrobiales bacterium]
MNAHRTAPACLPVILAATTVLLGTVGFSGDVDPGSLPDEIIANFEQDTYGDWQVTGEAFGSGPARGTLPGQMQVSGYQGHGLVNSFRGGDDSTGTLTSPEFRISRPYINLRVGGGGYAGETCIDLLVDGKVVLTVTGPNTEPGGSEALEWRTWDVRQWLGQTARIRIVDQRKGGWGHINADEIVQSGGRLEAADLARAFTVSQRYLWLPVKNGAPKRRMRFVVDGATVREFEIEYATGPADFQVFSDVSEFAGKQLTVECRLPGGDATLDAMVASDSVPDADGMYREALRPQFHFTSRRGWHNDPNGLVYFKGEFHLFYQHNPFGIEWGNMHWGHAVSSDLFHWQELPTAIYPPRFGDWVFSGSALVDWQNTSGFGKAGQPPMMAAWTSTGRGEAISYSNDRGRTWQEFEGNPVVSHRGRDPKVIRDQARNRWVMAVYDEDEGGRDVVFHTSSNLRDWTKRGRIKGYFECPDLFKLPVQGKAGESRWVLYAADGEYAIGEFDGEQFHPESGKHRLWHGNFYAAQSYSDAPDGRRIQIGWGRGITFPGMPFNQQMTVPVELTLRETPEGLRMFAQPVKELDRLEGEVCGWQSVELDAHRIRVELDPGSSNEVGLLIRGEWLMWKPSEHRLVLGDLGVPVPDTKTLPLDVLVDRGSIEVFVNEGAVAISKACHFDPARRSLGGISSKGANPEFKNIRVTPITPVWTALSR